MNIYSFSYYQRPLAIDRFVRIIQLFLHKYQFGKIELLRREKTSFGVMREIFRQTEVRSQTIGQKILPILVVPLKNFNEL